MRQTCSEPITSSLQVCLMHTHLLVQFKLQDVVKVRRTPTCGVAPALCSFIEEKVADRAIISSDIGIGGRSNIWHLAQPVRRYDRCSKIQGSDEDMRQ